jgi:sarcosine oxidase subunit gamma
MAELSLLSPGLRASMSKASWDGGRLTEQGSPTLVSVRARGSALMRLARALDLHAVPAANECHRTAFGDCYWLRPDEWLIAADSGDSGALIAAIDAAVGGDDGAVIDVSGSRVVLELSGPATRDVLASCCPLDLHVAAFPRGHCAQSLIAKASVLLQLVDDTPTWRLFVSPSYADYVVRWLVDGMEAVRAESRLTRVNRGK